MPSKFLRLPVLVACIVLAALPARAASLCSEGDVLQVLWHDTWYPAHAIKGEKNRCYITYDGYDHSWDEWVGPDRLKVLEKRGLNEHGPWKGDDSYHKGDKVLVLWRYLWYRATVLKTRHGRMYIHYDGWSSSWDEWVGPKRVRFRDPEGLTKPSP